MRPPIVRNAALTICGLPEAIRVKRESHADASRIWLKCGTCSALTIVGAIDTTQIF